MSLSSVRVMENEWQKSLRQLIIDLIQKLTTHASYEWSWWL